MSNNIRNHSLSLRGWTRSGPTGKSQGLHPEILKLAAEIGVDAVSTGAYGPRGPARSQADVADVFVGYYPQFGLSPWQVGNDRVCMSRAALVALLTEGEEPTETSQSARTFKDIKSVMVEAPKAETKAEADVPLAAVKAPVVVTEDEDEQIAALEAAVAAKLAKKARIAELKAQLAALE